MRSLRVVFIGMPGVFSTAPLTALLDHAIDVRAVIVPATAGRTTLPAIAPLLPPAPTSFLPIINTAIHPTIIQLAWERKIPLYEVTQLQASATHAFLQELAPDVICVACWAWRVPSAVLDLPPLGVLNVHPSLLPAYRGPEPAFWTLRDGLLRTGVTVHRMDRDFDTGPILRQLPVELHDSVTDNEVLRRCAERGGEALVDALRGLADGTLEPQPQRAGGSYAPIPRREDFMLRTSWSAQRAYTSMRGTAGWGVPFGVQLDDEQLLLTSARAYAASDVLGSPYERHGTDVLIQFTPGVLRAVMR